MYKSDESHQEDLQKASIGKGSDNSSGKWWGAKLAICIVYDFFDFTLGRFLFAVPFAGEIIGSALCYAMFGKQGLLYGLEAIDMTEQFDGFIPTATIIALFNKPTKIN